MTEKSTLANRAIRATGRAFRRTAPQSERASFAEGIDVLREIITPISEVNKHRALDTDADGKRSWHSETDTEDLWLVAEAAQGAGSRSGGSADLPGGVGAAQQEPGSSSNISPSRQAHSPGVEGSNPSPLPGGALSRYGLSPRRGGVMRNLYAAGSIAGQGARSEDHERKIGALNSICCSQDMPPVQSQQKLALAYDRCC